MDRDHTCILCTFFCLYSGGLECDYIALNHTVLKLTTKEKKTAAIFTGYLKFIFKELMEVKAFIRICVLYSVPMKGMQEWN